jgi:hypothetical protein
MPAKTAIRGAGPSTRALPASSTRCRAAARALPPSFDYTVVRLTRRALRRRRGQVATLAFTDSINENGWAFLEVHSNSAYSDDDQAYVYNRLFLKLEAAGSPVNQ